MSTVVRTKRSLSPRGKLRPGELGASPSSSSTTSDELDGGRSELDVRVLWREPVLATDMLAVWSCWSEGEGFPVGDRPFLLAGRPGRTQRSLGRLVYLTARLARVKSYGRASQHAVLRKYLAPRMAVRRQLGAAFKLILHCSLSDLGVYCTDRHQSSTRRDLSSGTM